MIHDNESFAPDQPNCCRCTVFPCQKRSTPGDRLAIQDLRSVQRTLFLIWSFLMGEGLWEVAVDYIREHTDEPSPLDLGFGIFEP